MKLSSITKYKGFYYDLHNYKFQDPTRVKIPISKNYKNDFQTISFLILIHLKSSSRGSAIKVAKMEPSDIFCKYLRKTYDLNGQYRNAQQFIDKNKVHLCLERIYNERDFCIIFSDSSNN